MSRQEDKGLDVKPPESGRARAKLNMACPNLRARKACSGIECARGFRVLERDMMGPVLVYEEPMPRGFYWRRVSRIEGQTFLMEPEKEVLLQPLGKSDGD